VLLMASAVLVDPAPIAVPMGLTEKSVAKAVKLGVLQRGWLVTREEPGYMEATLHLRSHMARIGIDYDPQSVKIRYIDSQNLDFKVKNDVRYIHGNYLKWINNAAHDISIQLEQATAVAPAG
jgi:hypothetical protein